MMFRNWILIAIWFGFCLGVALWAGKTYGQTTDWNASPYNWNNSQLNYDNSPLKWENSPLNWNNSQYNYGATNRVYDNEGQPRGYVTESPTGVTNYFSSTNGKREAYRPSEERK